jgi:hypothetical protein
MTRTATLRANVADHGDMAAAIIETYGRADDAQCIAGRAWYGTAGRMVRSIAVDAGMPAERVAHALAALSPRNPWRWNVADAYVFATAAAADPSGPIPAATTFRVNRARAWAALTLGHTAWATAAPKVTTFVAAILGDHGSIVIDTWAVRVATRGALTDVTDGEYDRVARAYRDAAAMVGETPSAMQAITWIVAQTDGLASSRRGRHDMTFKRGTPERVIAMFGEKYDPEYDEVNA